jgi:excisionase family DNA binding protein
MIEGTPNESVNRNDVLLTRERLAEALDVSRRTVDLMLADGEITPMRLRGKMVRFYLPDVLQELREKAKTSKRNVARRV